MNFTENLPTCENSDAEYLISYIQKVLLPASEEFHELLKIDQIKLHHAFSFTTILTHAIDYMVLIDRELNNRSRAKLLNEFDEIYLVQGAKHLNQKFKLLDAVNNAFKHVELDKKRYKNLINEYGTFTFDSLKVHNGRIFFYHPEYKFDYCRIVLKPIAAIFDCDIKLKDDVVEFLNGKKYGTLHVKQFESYDHKEYDPMDAIDRMIEYCDPKCLDCVEYQAKCECHSFFYANQKPDSNLDIDKNFDLKKTMAKISGTREWTI